jgi:hypothetical protein
VDRAVLFVTLLVIVGIVELSVWMSMRPYASPYIVGGHEIALQIDSEVGDMIAARFPAAAVGAAECPNVLDLTERRSARCTVPVSGSPLRIDVRRAYDGRRADFQAVDGLVVLPDAQRAVADDLALLYGEPFDVRCLGPAVRVLAPETPFICSIEAPDLLRRNLEIRAYRNDGAHFVFERVAVTPRAVRILGREVTERREGGVTVDARALERYVLGSAGFEARGEVGRRHLLGSARCPRRVVLKDLEHATCTVLVGGRTQRYDVRFDEGRGLVIDTQQTVEVLPVLRDIATRYFERSRHTGGKPLSAQIDCGTESVALVEPGTSLRCTAKVGDRSFAFAFQIADPQGGFTIETPEE